MGTIDDQLVADASKYVNRFGEEVVYTPAAGDDAGQALAIKAIIERSGPDPNREDGGRTLVHDVVISVQTSDVAEVTVDQDTVKLPVNRGEAARLLTVTRIIDQDAGIWRLGVGA